MTHADRCWLMPIDTQLRVNQVFFCQSVPPEYLWSFFPSSRHCLFYMILGEANFRFSWHCFNSDSLTKVVQTHHKFSKPKQKLTSSQVLFQQPVVTEEGVSFLRRRRMTNIMTSVGTILVLFTLFQHIFPGKVFLVETEDKEVSG